MQDIRHHAEDLRCLAVGPAGGVIHTLAGGIAPDTTLRTREGGMKAPFDSGVRGPGR